MLGEEGELEKRKQGRKVRRLGGKGGVVGKGRSWGQSGEGLKRKHEE